MTKIELYDSANLTTLESNKSLPHLSHQVKVPTYLPLPHPEYLDRIGKCIFRFQKSP